MPPIRRSRYLGPRKPQADTLCTPQTNRSSNLGEAPWSTERADEGLAAWVRPPGVSFGLETRT